MAAYDAIRDSFREFNRTLIDAQAWNTQHQLSAADTKFKQTMLMNQLNQQQFNNDDYLFWLQRTNKVLID
jgi:hypothetical protein